MARREALPVRFAGPLRIAALICVGLLLAANLLDIALDVESGAWQMMVFDLCGLPLGALMIGTLLCRRDVRNLRLLPVALLFLFFGGYAYYAAYLVVAALILPAFLERRPPLPQREARRAGPLAICLPLLLLVLVLWNFNGLLRMLGVRWSLREAIHPTVCLLYPTAMILLCAPALWGLLRSDWHVLRKNGEVYARRAIPLALVGSAAYLGLRFAAVGELYLGAIASEFLAALPLPVAIVVGLMLVPVAEGLIYQGLIRRVIPGKALFLLVSSLLFALIRVEFGGPLPELLLDLAAYGAMGFAIGVSYTETDNLFCPMLTHAYLNLILMLSNLSLFSAGH